ncbi:MAG: Mur ligase domain-containing protein [Candidatus Pacebacteria bacterium]|nr:Mur ligase domain-containing protein [Candidatus Paceibacterota bacterium]
MKIYFIGIGGIGISALARYYLKNGHEVSGSDPFNSEIIQALQKEGAKVFIGKQVKEHIENDIDLVIYSPAVKEDNEEFKEARNKGTKLLSYPEALGKLSKDLFTIAVSGTHGKSTTTTMIAFILIEAGLDPTVIVGTKVKEFGDSNLRLGNSKYLVIEACEYEDSFLNYHPDIGVILNIEADHLDYFKTFEKVKESFNKFANQSKQVIIEKKFDNLIDSNNKIVLDKSEMIKPSLNVPGEFNITNAMHAIMVARELKIDDETSLKALAKFKGTWRRMDIDDTSFNFTIINDYAHHPTEIGATLKAVREKYPDKNIYCIFQPHQYERTFNLFDDFVKAFNEALSKKYLDHLFIFPIYTVEGRESQEIKNKVSTEKLALEIKGANLLKDFENAKEITFNLNKNDVLIIMGAGNIYNLYKYLLDEKQNIHS